MKQLILDTDIDSDVDDAGALAVLHALSRTREVQILGVVCSIPRRTCALCVSAINEWYGRADVPVGLVNVPDWEMAPRFASYRRHRPDGEAACYNEIIGREWLQGHPGSEFEDAVSLYRKLLAQAGAGAVTICAIGTLTALAQLLESGADTISPLDGRGLVAAKVERLVTMAIGTYPEGADRFNWAMDRVGAATVLNGWPTPITVSEVGGNVLTGRDLIAAAPPDNPVGRAYEIWFDRWKVKGGRSSWDQLAVVRAVRGCGGVFREHGELGLTFDSATGEHAWLPTPNGPERAWIETTVPDADLATLVETLMIDSARDRDGAADRSDATDRH